MRLDSGDGAGLGDIVESLEDIAQCIVIILTTPKGSDPLRPTFAIDLLAFIDKPMTSIVPHAVREVMSALRQWEPRIVVTRVSVLPDSDQNYGHVNISVYWQLNVQAATQTYLTIVGLPVIR
jgi:uncharacterized protein